jgi:hypothetical protein
MTSRPHLSFLFLSISSTQQPSLRNHRSSAPLPLRTRSNRTRLLLNSRSPKDQFPFRSRNPVPQTAAVVLPPLRSVSIAAVAFRRSWDYSRLELAWSHLLFHRSARSPRRRRAFSPASAGDRSLSTTSVSCVVIVFISSSLHPNLWSITRFLPCLRTSQDHQELEHTAVPTASCSTASRSPCQDQPSSQLKPRPKVSSRKLGLSVSIIPI